MKLQISDSPLNHLGHWWQSKRRSKYRGWRFIL